MKAIEALVIVVALLIVAYGLFPHGDLRAGPMLESERMITMAIALLALFVAYLLALTLLDAAGGSQR
jgi:hypothetical protein